MSRCRQVNAERRDWAENLVLGYHGPLWTPEDIAYGSARCRMSRGGPAHGSGRWRRCGKSCEELGIRNPAGNRWLAEEIALLGRCRIGKRLRLGRSLQSVTQSCIKLRIGNSLDNRREV